MKNDCIFCKIVKGKIPTVKIFEDEECIVILDRFPATKGQALVVPKLHVEYIMSLEDGLYTRLFLMAKKSALALDRSFHTLRTCFVVEGFEISHVHIRLHPCYEPILKIKGVEESTEELQRIAVQIHSFL